MNEDRIITNSIQKPVDKKNYSEIFFKRPPVLGIITFMLLAVLFSVLIYQRYELVKESKRKEASEILNLAKERIQEALIHSLSATKTIALFIDKNGSVNAFDSIAAYIIETGYFIDALQLVPNGVIKYVYPFKGNEKIIGYDILKDTARNAEALKAIEKKQLFFTEPFELKQGGIGVVGRLPIYRNNKFWGFSAVVIKMATLFKFAAIDSTGKRDYFFQLSKINPNTKEEKFFLPLQNIKSHTQSVSVMVPNGEWKLSVSIPTSYRDYVDIILLSVIGFLFSVFCAFFIYRISAQPKLLQEQVIIRTSQLAASENNYRSVIERVSDAFVALNNNWVYTYVNEKAGELLSRSPQALVGKNIWTEFPEAIDQPFYYAYKRAMEIQEYQYQEEYFPTLNRWIENHIYPSKNGLTVFFKDVTEIKQITLALQNNEEKYRTLIEQASDGIVITDLEGIILEVNKSIQKMVGYVDEEMIGYHLTDFLPEEDMEVNPLRIHELMKGKNLLYERKLKKKDGFYLEVDVNSKMASSHTLIGFIRDITERKNYENTLMYQAGLLESVSDAVTSIDMNRCIVSWNSACVELYGFTAEEVIGKRIPELATFEYPNSNNEEVFKQVFSEGKWKGEFNFIHPKTKEKIKLLSNINLLKDKNGSLKGFIITSKNITDRIKGEEEIKSSNERFELIAQATNDAIWDHDFVKNETWGNENLYKIYGLEYGNEKITFEMFLSRILPEQRERIELRMNNALAECMTSLSEEFLFKTASGEYRNFYDRAYIKYDSEGKPLRILGAMQDITEREKIKQQIIREKELSDTLINALPGIFCLYTKDGKLLRWNRNFETVTGYSGKEISQLHPLDLIDIKDRPLAKEKMTNVFLAGSDEVESDFLSKSGEKIPYFLTGQVIEYEGETCLMGVGLDFSERKKAAEVLVQSEQKYRLLFYDNPSPMWMSTLPDLNIIDVNEAAIKQYGYSREEFLKLTLKDMRPAEDVPHFLEEIENIDLSIKNNRQWRHKKKDGNIIQVEVKTNAIFYEGKQVWLSMLQDVTEKNVSRELLQKSYNDIRQLASNLQSIREDERTSIAREIHDELGQQLTGLKMDIYWLSRKINTADKAITNKLKESLELINSTVATVRKIATDLRPSILDDLGLIAAIEWQGEEFEKRSGIEVEINNEAGEVLLKPEAITTIFRIYQELLTNVARHANASLVKVLLQKRGDSLFFSLKDDGIGFDPEITGNKKTLGLLGIRERTLILGGTYEFKSKPGEGSRTIISIPLL
jgi:PAS domain S-box-containing protein